MGQAGETLGHLVVTVPGDYVKGETQEVEAIRMR